MQRKEKKISKYQPYDRNVFWRTFQLSNEIVLKETLLPATHFWRKWYCRSSRPHRAAGEVRGAPSLPGRWLGVTLENTPGMEGIPWEAASGSSLSSNLWAWRSHSCHSGSQPPGDLWLINFLKHFQFLISKALSTRELHTHNPRLVWVGREF